jgi:SAM-dependent methyltransferase
MPDLHPLAHGFARVTAEYERGRPGYAPEAVAALGLGPGARVADVGAGTGKLTRALVAAGLDVVAVDPLAAMRDALRAAVPDVEVLDGTAEALPLADASVDAVVCADAAHWFDPARAPAELARVIAPGGTLGLIWNGPAAGGARPAWEVELGALLAAVRPEHPAFAPDQGRGMIEDHAAFGPLTATHVDHAFRQDRSMMLDAIASHSYVAALPDAERDALRERVDALLRRHGLDTIDVELRTTVYTARRF